MVTTVEFAVVLIVAFSLASLSATVILFVPNTCVVVRPSASTKVSALPLASATLTLVLPIVKVRSSEFLIVAVAVRAPLSTLIVSELKL